VPGLNKSLIQKNSQGETYLCKFGCLIKVHQCRTKKINQKYFQNVNVIYTKCQKNQKLLRNQKADKYSVCCNIKGQDKYVKN
jgi:hypothetical protein